MSDTNRWLTDLLADLNLPPKPQALLVALFASIDDDPAEDGRHVVDKADVVERLRRAEGAELSPEAMRQRIQTVRNRLAAATEDEPPLFELKSSKHHLTLDWSESALAAWRSRRVQRTVSEAALEDRLHMTGETIEPQFSVPEYQVFVSHGWESEEVESVVDDFIDTLSGKLQALPETFRDRFRVSLWIDRERVHGRSADFDTQTVPACEASAFGLFLMSAKWCGSRGCQAEARVFEQRNTEHAQPYLGIVLTGTRTEIDRRWQSMPLHPLGGDFAQHDNLLTLWSRGDLPTRDQFAAAIRDEICEHLAQFGNAQPSPVAGPPQPQLVPLGEYLKATSRKAIDVHREALVSPEFIGGPGGERSNRSQGIPAIESLMTWATDDSAPNRRVVILGGFGMGKTTTVQLLAEALLEKLDAGEVVPTPVYLDFRRLIARTEQGKAVEGELSELILAALPAEARARLSGDDLLAFIRRENCLVIFDGLDEVGTRIGREYAALLHRQFEELIPARVAAEEASSGTPNWSACCTRLLLTCRTHFFRSVRGEQNLFSGFSRKAPGLQKRDLDGGAQRRDLVTHHMAPLSRERIQALFRLTLGPAEGERVFAMVREVHDLTGLSARPIMARFICEMADSLIARHEAGGQLNIAAVYEALFQAGLDRDADKRPLLNAQDRQDILTQLAKHLHCNSSGPQTADELERWFDRFAIDHPGIGLILQSGRVNTRALLHAELENASFLIRDGDHFSFAHTSFYEYFLANAIFQALESEAEIERIGRRPVNLETRDFVRAIAAREQAGSALVDALSRQLCGAATASARRLAFDLLHGDSGDWRLPAGANLADFDLRDSKLTALQWQGIDLRRTQLNGLDARDVRFSACQFNGAVLAGAKLQACQFIDCEGRPLGLASARGVEARLPEPWAAEIAKADRAAYWRPIDPNKPVSIVLDIATNTVAFSPDGRRVITAGDHHRAYLCDANSGTNLLRFEGHSDDINSVAFSPDGRRALTGSDDKTARLWDVDSGAQLLCLEGHRDIISSVAFSPNGRRVLTGSNDNTARVWDADSGALLLCLERHSSTISSVAFSSNGRRVLTGSYDRTARLWDADSGAQLLCLESSMISSVAFSPNSRRVLTGSYDNTARLWDADSGAELLSLEGHSDDINCVAFSPDGKRVITGSDDKTARLWDALSGTELLRLKGHGDDITSVAFSSDGRRVITGSDDKTARLWDADSGAELLRLERRHGDDINSVAFSPDGRRVITGGDDKTARLWDAESGAQLLRLVGHSEEIISVAFSPDGRRALTGSYDDTARVWDADSGAELLCLEGHGDDINSVAFSPDGRRVITGGDDKTARLWDAKSGAQLLRLEGHSEEIISVAFSPDGRRALTGSFDHTARVWDADSGAELLCLEGHIIAISSVAFSPDGRRVLTGSYDNTARLWDADSGAELLCLRQHIACRSGWEAGLVNCRVFQTTLPRRPQPK